MEFDVLDMISKNLGSGGKRLPTLGYQLTSQDPDLLEHVLSVGYRHFMFEPCFTQVLADTLQEYAGDEDIFLTLRVPVHTGKFNGAQQIVVKALAMMGLAAVDMVLLYDNKRGSQNQDESSIWHSRWKELESLHDRGMVRNIGLYTDEPDDVTSVESKARIKPAVVFIPTVGSSQKVHKSKRALVVNACKTLGVQSAVALDVDLKNPHKTETPNAKMLCRTVVEAGFGFVVSSEDENIIIETSEVFDHTVPIKRRSEIMNTLGLTV